MQLLEFKLLRVFEELSNEFVAGEILSMKKSHLGIHHSKADQPAQNFERYQITLGSTVHAQSLTSMPGELISAPSRHW